MKAKLREKVCDIFISTYNPINSGKKVEAEGQ